MAIDERDVSDQKHRLSVDEAEALTGITKLGEQRKFILWFDKEFHDDDVKPGENRQVADLPLEGIPDKSVRRPGGDYGKK